MDGGEIECGQLSSEVWQGRQEQDGRSWGLDWGHLKILTEYGDGIPELPECRQQRDREQGSTGTVVESPGRHRGQVSGDGKQEEGNSSWQTQGPRELAAQTHERSMQRCHVRPRVCQ